MGFSSLRRALYMALGMAAEGMRGSTLEQTLSLLAAEDRPALRQGNRELQSLMSGNTKGYFHLATPSGCGKALRPA